MSRIARISLTALAIPAILLTGSFKAYPVEVFAGAERTVVLDPHSYPVAHRAGRSYFIDLSNLHLDDRAANALHTPEMRVRFFEDGEPLVDDVDHGRIETEPGRYSHWLHYVIFSPRGHVPEGPYSIRYLELDESRRWLRAIGSPAFWGWVAAGCLLGLAAIRFFDPRPWWSCLLVLGLAGATVPHVVKYWDTARTMADSESYVKNSARPPLYPWFIQAVKGGAEWKAEDFRASGMPLPEPSAAILRVVRAQRVVAWTCFLVAAAASCLLVPPALAVLLFFALYLNDMLLPDLEGSLMSEPLALSFLFLVIAAFCLVAAWRRPWPLPFLAMAYGCLVLTRSAGVFAIVFVAAGIGIAVATNWRNKRALAGALTATGLVGLSAIVALLANSHARSGAWTLSPLHNWERVAFAVQVADAADVDAAPDADARQFLDEALQQRLVRRRDARVEDFDLNLNCWEIAYPLAQGMFVARFGMADLPEPGEYTPALYGYVNGLFGRVADVVLARHRDRYLRVVAHSFFTRAASGHTRLHWQGVPFLWLWALGLAACLIGRNTCALAGATCLVAHLGNLMVMSFFELPMQRYVFFSEWVCLLGFLLAGIGCGQWIVGTIAGRRRPPALSSEATP